MKGSPVSLADETRENLHAMMMDIIEELCRRAYIDGGNARANAIMAAAAGVGGGTILGGLGSSPSAFGAGEPPMMTPEQMYPIESGVPMPRPRAPKGLAESLIAKVLVEGPQEMGALQQRVTAMDSRVPPKTIYNILHVNKHGRYIRAGHRWALKPADAVQGEPAEPADEDDSAESFFS
jgi:hypothetical protein